MMCLLSQTPFTLVVLVAIFNLGSSCLITNCPRGGKRDGSENTLLEIKSADLRTCTPCGPNKLGVCVGQDICCGKHFGCLIASPHTRICRRLHDFKESCLSAFSSCGEDGLCVAKDVCCSKTLCKMDGSCKSIPAARFDYKESDFLRKLPFRYSGDNNLLESEGLASEPLIVNELLEPLQESLISKLNYRSEES